MAKPKQLQYQTATILSRRECRHRFPDKFRPYLHDSVLCTITPVHQGACKGDSGSPLINANGECVGIVSWGIPCGYSAPDVYARIHSHLPFIKSISGLEA